MSSDDKLGYHSRQTKEEHAEQIYQYESGSTVLTGHIREAPHVSKSYRRAGSGKNHAYLGSEISSLFHKKSFD